MSLAIQCDDVTAVMIGDRWHRCQRGSFTTDSFELMDGSHVLHGGGNSGVCASGFRFLNDGDDLSDLDEEMCGPLTAIQALRTAGHSR